MTRKTPNVSHKQLRHKVTSECSQDPGQPCVPLCPVSDIHFWHPPRAWSHPPKAEKPVAEDVSSTSDHHKRKILLLKAARPTITLSAPHEPGPSTARNASTPATHRARPVKASASASQLAAGVRILRIADNEQVKHDLEELNLARGFDARGASECADIALMRWRHLALVGMGRGEQVAEKNR